MYDGNVLPTPILAIHGIAIAHPEIVEVHQYRRVIDDERQEHSIQGVSDDALPTGRSSIGNRDASSHGRDEPDLRQADDVDSTRMTMPGKGVGSVCAAKSVALVTTPQRAGVTLGK
ncbi:MAG: hypothetical protein VX656_14575 [Candidatus Latescibacterota bacterium]|nr:hypothetical protein [Candidatus Latescibacterota bacterium]